MAFAATLGAAALLTYVSPAFGAAEFDPQFYSSTWGGTCATGKLQTPIDLVARYDTLPDVPADLVTTINMPLVQNPKIVNKGSAIQVRSLPLTREQPLPLPSGPCLILGFTASLTAA